jgi:predicted ATPase
MKLLKKMEFNHWNQFEKIEIDIHPQLTILTGVNGSGKSTILRLLGKTIGWEFSETGIPIDRDVEEVENMLNKHFKSGLNRKQILKSNVWKDFTVIGSFYDTEGGKAKLCIPNETDSAVYSIALSPEESWGFQSLPGVYIPSHRIPYSYKKVENIPVKPILKEEAFNKYNNTLQKRLSNVYYDPNADDPIIHMKSTFISLALFGEGNSHIASDKEAYLILSGFIKVLKILLPESLGFKDIRIRNGEIVLKTNSGEFLLDAVSGGIGAVISLAWQIYMYNKDEKFVVLIDEAENHLHPSMQRSLLPNLLKAFPNAQFIITTHSPFMVNSVIESKVYALTYNENNLIESNNLDFGNKVSSAAEVLRNVLEVPVTFPIWLEDKLNQIVEKYSKDSLTAESYQDLKNDLKNVGLDEHLPDALRSLDHGGKM